MLNPGWSGQDADRQAGMDGVDEFGGVSGIVTLEDLIEEIVGDIKDEYDDDEGQPLQIISDREAILLGSLPLTDVNRTFNLNIESQDADTIAGYVIEELGYLPKPGEEPEVARDDFTLRVLRTKNTRIELVRLTLPEPPAGPADADEDSAD